MTKFIEIDGMLFNIDRIASVAPYKDHFKEGLKATIWTSGCYDINVTLDVDSIKAMIKGACDG